jgi:hypothetical protein
VNLSFDLDNALHHVFHPIKAHTLEINLFVKNIRNVIDRKINLLPDTNTGQDEPSETGVGRRFRP